MNCELWPWSAANRKETYLKGKPWPTGVLAITHTHPRSAGPEPSAGDIATADRLGLPIYTVTQRGIFKYDSEVGGEPTKEEGSDWIKRAADYRKEHQKGQSCSCSQIK